MATAPTLGGTTLPYPSGYRERVGYRGAFSEMADGTVAVDLVNVNAKREFTVTWRAITAANKTTIETAFATVKNASATFLAPTNTSYTVTRHPDQAEIEFEAIKQNSTTLRFNVEMRLREA